MGKPVNSSLGWGTSLPGYVMFRYCSKNYVADVNKQKQEMSSLNFNFNLQACWWGNHALNTSKVDIRYDVRGHTVIFIPWCEETIFAVPSHSTPTSSNFNAWDIAHVRKLRKKMWKVGEFPGGKVRYQRQNQLTHPQQHRTLTPWLATKATRCWRQPKPSTLQGGTTCCTVPFVDAKTKVTSK